MGILCQNLALFTTFGSFLQDEFGNTQYGYTNINSAKHEVGNALAGVSGTYQYVDPNGQLQTVQYVADALGFRTADSRLPVAPVHDAALPVAPVYNGKIIEFVNF